MSPCYSQAPPASSVCMSTFSRSVMQEFAPTPAPPHSTLPDTHGVTLVILLVLISSIEQGLFIYSALNRIRCFSCEKTVVIKRHRIVDLTPLSN